MIIIEVALDVARNNYDTFLALAAKVAAVHDQLERQREQYLRWRRAVGKENEEPSLMQQHRLREDKAYVKFARVTADGGKVAGGSSKKDICFII
jgi:AmiR/NasT family two-component response regulator